MSWALVGLAALVALPPASGEPAFAEITPMSRSRVDEAEQVARKASDPSAIFHSETCRTRDDRGILVYDVTLTTPFTAVAAAASEAMRTDTPIDLAQWPIDPPEKQHVIVTVDPAWLHPAGEPAVAPRSVAKVFLRRGEAVVEPVRADTHEVRFPEAAEGARRYRGGAFYFPLEPFASEQGKLEIVILPEGAPEGTEAVVKLSQPLLSRLR